ncbi:methyl-accepting chemotaxis protein [Pengzhenrongella phosphoraccumulans]|uniref:methyl-accepting chemotaxis protein n=1 Tax=Pengzhenrongella phosphoraccumulans TaxID=3114394 RepID=UPI00388FD746
MIFDRSVRRRHSRSGPWAWFRDRRLSTKLFTVVLALTATFAGVGGYGALVLLQTSAQTDLVASRSNGVLVPMQDARVGQIRSQLMLRQLAMSRTDSGRDRATQAIVGNDALVRQAIELVDANLAAPLPAWDDFLVAWEGWVTFRDATLLPLAQAGDVSAVDLAIASAPAADADAQGRSIALAARVVGAQIDAAAASARSEMRQTMAILVGVFAVGTFLAALLAFAVIRSVTRGVRGVQRSLVAMSDGDLTVSASVVGRDEIGAMAQALATAQESLRAMLAGVAGTAATVASAAAALAASNAQVAAGSDETSTQSGVIAAAAERVSQNVQTVASGAEQMGASIREIAQNSNQAANVAGYAVEVSDSTAATVRELGQSSQDIGAVVKVITSIAKQTNLLALNATIEAARAGAAGRGFAVVAKEVKELARESALAAEDIGQRIATTQDAASSAVVAIGEISAIIASINDFQLTIASAVEEQTATTNEMSRSVGQAAEGSEEIAMSMSRVASSAAEASAVLGQMSGSVDELARMSQDLRERVAAFTY